MTTLWTEKLTMVRFMLAAALGLGIGAGACTPATPDAPTGTGGRTASGSGGATNPTGSGGSSATGSGGSVGSAGSGGSSGASGGAVGSGGATVSGTGGAAAGSGGARGTGGATVSGGGTTGAGGAVASGCNWIHNTVDDTWTMNPASADKIVLFDGTSLANWHVLNMPTQQAQWKLIGDGSMEVVPVEPPTNIQSNMKFDDVCVHVEYLTPTYPSNVDTQMQGNSGVYLKSAYEMQILDTHNSPPLIDGCGAVYKVSPPLVVACNMFLVWNTYEIEFKSSVWDNSSPPVKTKDAVFVQSVLNGKLVQKNVDLNPAGGFTQAGIPDVAGPQPLALQDHRDLVRFRNIWVTIPKK